MLSPNLLCNLREQGERNYKEPENFPEVLGQSCLVAEFLRELKVEQQELVQLSKNDLV